MSSGVVHQRVALITLGVTGGIGVFLTLGGASEAAIGAVTGATVGAIITPDIDQEGRTKEEKRMYGIPVVGRPIGFLWQWYWYGYALLFRHRGLSHVPIAGTFTRLAYMGVVTLACWLGIVGVLLLISGEDVLPIIPIPSASFTVSFLTAWIVQDFMHWTFDKKHPYRWLAMYGCIVSIAILVVRSLS